MKSFIEKFSELLESVPSEAISELTVFKNIEEWDSLLALSLITMVDEEYNVKLSGDEIRSANTIADIYTIIKSKQ